CLRSSGRLCNAASASPLFCEKRETETTLEPNAITDTRSLAGLEATNWRAAAIAFANFAPFIERERSIASTTDFEFARFTAWRPVTWTPSSVRAGWNRGPAEEMTVARMVG